jgi:hypothetical protein
MKRYAYRTEGLAGEVFLNPVTDKYKLAIFCFGFPGTIGNNPIVSLLVDLDYAVFVHQYSGTYDSDGGHSVETAIQSIIDLAKLVNNGCLRDIKNNNVIPLGDSPRVSLLAAHSFGCFLGARAASRIESIRDLLLFAPILGYGRAPIDYGVREDGLFQLEYVRRARPHTYRLTELPDWRAMFEGNRNVWTPAADTTNRVVSIVGGRDGDFDVEVLRQNYREVIRSILGEVSSAELRVVGNAGHGDTDLVTEDIASALRGWTHE